MADETLLQNFQIALEWKDNQPSAKKFQGAIDESTKSVDRIARSMLHHTEASKGFRESILSTTTSVVGLETGFGAAAIAVDAFASAMSASTARAYFSAKNLGTSIGTLEDVKLSFENVGVSASETQGVMENLRQMQIATPGINAILTGALGVKPEDLHDTAKMLPEIAKGLQSIRSETVAWQYAQQIGIPFDMFQAIYERGATGSEDHTNTSAYARLGLDMEQAGKDAAEFQAHLRDLDADTTAFGRWIDHELNGPLEGFIKWTEQAETKLMAFIGTAQAHGLSAALQQAGMPKAMADAITNPDSAKVLNDWSSLANNPTPAGMHQTIQDTNAAVGGGLTWAWNQLKRGAQGYEGVTERNMGRFGLYVGGHDSAANATAQQYIRYLMGKGLTRNQAAAMVSEAWGETGGTFDPQAFNPAGGGRGAIGMFQDRGSRIDDLVSYTGKDPSQLTAQDELDFAAYEVLRGKEKGNASAFLNAPNAATAGLAYSRDIARTGNSSFDNMNAGRADRLGSVGDINITVNGANDPHGSAKAVTDALRYFLPRVQ